jgi:predicted nucleic acid-binding protein
MAPSASAGAEAIITGDKDLLDHKEQLDPPALNLREACELLALID